MAVMAAGGLGVWAGWGDWQLVALGVVGVDGWPESECCPSEMFSQTDSLAFMIAQVHSL